MKCLHKYYEILEGDQFECYDCGMFFTNTSLENHDYLLMRYWVYKGTKKLVAASNKLFELKFFLKKEYYIVDTYKNNVISRIDGKLKIS